MNKNIIIGVVAVVVLIAVIFYPKKSSTPEVVNETSIITPLPTKDVQEENEDATISPMQGNVTELIIEDLEEGTGEEAVSGKKITVNYRGTLTNGTQFDSSYDRNQPFSFVLGAGSVIEGWEKGFEGMKVGGKRKLTIPSDMGYGSRAMGAIPADSVLIFEVELLGVE